MEGRAARRRVRAVAAGPSGRPSLGGRRRHRGQRRGCAATSGELPRVDPARVHVVVQRHRHRRVRAGRRRPTCWSGRRRPGRAVRPVRRADHPAEGARRTCCGPRADLPGQLVLCAGAPDTPEIAAETARAGRGAAAHARPGVVWISDMLPKAESCSCSARDRASSARRSTSRSASSTSRPWPAPRRWSPASRRHPRGRRRRRDRACSCPTTRPTRRPSSAAWPSGRGPAGRPGAGRGAGRGRPGPGGRAFGWTPSPGRPWRSTSGSCGE